MSLIRTSPPETTRAPSEGACYLYVLPCAYEDLLKLGFSRQPLARMQALQPRWFEFFDLDRALLVETDTVREARRLELDFGRRLRAHGAPAPLTVRPDDATRPEGVQNPPFNVTFTGFVLGQGPGVLGGTLVIVTPATPASPPGVYVVTPSGLVSTNYTINFVNGRMTVTPAVVPPPPPPPGPAVPTPDVIDSVEEFRRG